MPFYHFYLSEISIPWGQYGIHGTAYPWFIGKSNASQGCIRMKNAHAKELYALLPHGSIVIIEQNNVKFRNLSDGDIGSDVCTVQTALKELGYYNGSIDGRFGPALKSSVKKFQSENNLPPKGILTKQTHNAILKALEKP